MQKPNCYDCKHRSDIPGDCHSCCLKISARVKGYSHAISKGYFFWPFNFDPIWLLTCDSFESNYKNDSKD